MPAGVHNGNSLTTEQRQEVITLLANRVSCKAIGRDLGISEHVVAAIRDIEWREVARRKDILANQEERIALMANDRLIDMLESGKEMSATELNVVKGTATDKALSLRGDNVQTIRHLHAIEATDEDFIAWMIGKQPKPIEATVIDSPLLPDQSQSGSGSGSASASASGTASASASVQPGTASAYRLKTKQKRNKNKGDQRPAEAKTKAVTDTQSVVNS